MKMNVEFVEDGSVEFVYRKTNSGCHGEDSGSFQFNIGMKAAFIDEGKQSHKKTFKQELTKGRYELSWLFVIYGNYCALNELVAFELLQIKLNPVSYAPTFCTSCKGAYSESGAARCIGCPANYQMTDKDKECVKCGEDEMSYPGENSCRARPKCGEYDVVKILGDCVDGVRTVRYEWREELFCSKNSAQLPQAQSEPCPKCPKGSYITSGECVACPSGSYSNTEDAKECKQCSSHTFAMPLTVFGNFTEVPAVFENRCEAMDAVVVDVCHFHTGWIAAKEALTAHPQLPKGARLILKKEVKIKESFGVLKVSYVGPGAEEEAEELKVQVDGFTTALELGVLEKTFFHVLRKGNHTVELIYEKVDEETGIVPVKVTGIRIEGEEGSADYCASCPPGSFAAGGVCTLCDPGTELNAESTGCDKCGDGYFKDEQATGCQRCPAHTYSFEDRTKCVLYDAYNVNDKYALFMGSFDSTREQTNKSLTYDQDKSFFGPFSNSTNTITSRKPRHVFRVPGQPGKVQRRKIWLCGRCRKHPERTHLRADHRRRN
eukprot:TRINITY_DN7893_c0_g3_i2.p1 TRINITY_DN7893_c0_g3~~TRINITY_DN7893_c0_g3_i2.p1  ORF type:complete len:547 (-),score=114.20 TRINITY_DN7893_c0_g3_i2:1455-3095(-)